MNNIKELMKLMNKQSFTVVMNQVYDCNKPRNEYFQNKLEEKVQTCNNDDDVHNFF